jgi:hypothetical protein
MDNLKLVEHFETLKKFLLMEDGEFSYSLTQQLFEKVQITGVPIQNNDNISFNNQMNHAKDAYLSRSPPLFTSGRKDNKLTSYTPSCFRSLQELHHNNYAVYQH